jgi:hypothetical protein
MTNIKIIAPSIDDIHFEIIKYMQDEDFAYKFDNSGEQTLIDGTYTGIPDDFNFHISNLTAKLRILQSESDYVPAITYKLIKPDNEMAEPARRRGRPPLNRKPSTSNNSDKQTKPNEPVDVVATESDVTDESKPSNSQTKEPIMTQSNGSNGNNDNQSDAAKRVRQEEQRKKQDAQITGIIDTITYYTTLVVSLPFRIFGSVLENFVDRRLPGTKILGFLFFFGSIIVTADSYWQASGNAAILPFFNESFNGWSFLFFFSPFFWGLVVFCLGMQYLQSETLRGMTAAEAKSRVEEMNAYDAGSAPQGKIKMASIYHKNYVNAGVRHNRFRSLFALGALVTDCIVTFAARNPYEWADRMFLGFWVVVAFNLISLVIAEAGYILWKSTK